jgi:hypothetical protein
MPRPLQLSDHTCNAIDALCQQHEADDAKEHKKAIPAPLTNWVASFGAGLSAYLPYLYQTWRALAAKGVSGLPSVQVFAAEFDLIVNGPPAVAPVPTPAAK